MTNIRLVDSELTAADWIAECRSAGLTDAGRIVFSLYALLSDMIGAPSAFASAMGAQGALLLAAGDPDAAGWLCETMAVGSPGLTRKLEQRTGFVREVVRELRAEQLR